MPINGKSEESTSVWVVPAAEPLDEGVWRAWVAKGPAQDRRRNASQIKAVKWVSIAAFLVAAGLWSRLAPFEVAFRFIVTALALVAMSTALRGRHYAVAAAFGALALFYNPVAPLFSFSSEWQRVVVLASTAPFIASLARPTGSNVRVAPQ